MILKSHRKNAAIFGAKNEFQKSILDQKNDFEIHGKLAAIFGAKINSRKLS